MKISAQRAAYNRKYWAANREILLAKKLAVRAADREADRAYGRRRYARRRTEILAQAKAWREANPDYGKKYRGQSHVRARERDNQRRRKGLPVPTRPCPAVCESCDQLPGKSALALDHCHSTGKFRGWLCRRCNIGIGQLGDTIAGLLRAVAYLRRGVK